jgi:hypothetical protein
LYFVKELSIVFVHYVRRYTQDGVIRSGQLQTRVLLMQVQAARADLDSNVSHCWWDTGAKGKQHPVQPRTAM